MKDLFRKINKFLRNSVPALQAELTLSDEHFRTLVDNLPGAIYRCALDEHWTMQFISKDIEAISGYPAGDFLNNRLRSYTSIIHPADRELVKQGVRNGVEQHRFYEMDYRLIDTAGRTHWVHEKGQATYGAGGVPLWLDGAIFDVTERVQAESEVARYQEHLEEMVAARTAELEEASWLATLTKFAFDHAPDPILWLKVDACLVYVNDYSCQLLGYTKEEMLKMKVFDIDPVYNADIWPQFLEQMSKQGHLTFESVWIRKDKSEFPVEISARYLAYKGEQYFIAFIRDISERKAVEAELTQAKETAETASQTKSEFLANMSHEIRTPMNAVLGFAEILKRMEADPKKAHYLDNIHTSGKTLLNLINDILDISKIEAGKLKLHYSAVSITSLFEEMKVIFEKKTADKGLRFEMEIDKRVPEALVLDESRLRQVCIKLLGNAIKFTETGAIRLTGEIREAGSSEDRAELVLCVKDTGIGIPKEQQAKLFGTFEQMKGQGKKLYGGTGLGLAISHRLINMMNGDISVESESGQGAAFRIVLHNVEIVAGKPENASPPEMSKAIVFEPASILIADDIPYNREILATFLGDMPFSLTFAENGQQVLDQCREKQPDLILLDIKMPVMDGREAAEIMRHDEKLKNIPLIIITVSVRKQDEAAIAKLCNSSLRKPVERKELVGELMKYLAYSPALESMTEEKTDELPAEARHASNQEALSGLLQQLESGPCKQWNNREQLSINEIRAFAETLTRLGEEFNDPLLANWGTQLQKAVAAFEIDAINQQMSEFPKILQTLKDDLSRLER